MDPAMLAAIAQALAGASGGAASDALSAASVSKHLDALREAQKNASPEILKTTFSQSSSATSGLTAYDLEGPAKLLYPVLTPLRNMIPRVSGKGGIQANWRAITGVNTSKISAGVSEGNRGGVISVTTADYIAAYRGIGFEDNVTFEAQYAGDGFDDVRARAVTSGLHSLMIAEEALHLAGNGTLALGTTPTPSLTASTTGGSLGTMTLSVICVALTHTGLNLASVSGGVVQSYSRTNADGSSDTINGGTAQKSTNATVSVTGSTGKVTGTVAAVRGAYAYAWFWATAGSEVLGAITNYPAVTITATATGTQTASSLASTDNSLNPLVYDGLITQALKSGSNAYWADLGGAQLTADGDGGVVEINTLLQNRWDLYRLNPNTIWVSSTEAQSITDRVLAGKTNGALRFNVDVKQGMVAGGTLVTSYLNRFGMNGATELTIRQHPNLPQGTILVTTDTIPYPLSGISNVVQVRTRQDYYQIEWPLRSRKYEYGVYADQVLQHYFPPAMAVITGILPG
jgi:hypothetical protein